MPRAQIFQSFDSLKGFRELLKKQEKIKVDKIELSEDDYEELDRIIHNVNVNDMIKVVYYKNDEYIQLEGKVTKLNLDTRIIQIVKTKLNLDDIVNIEIGK